MVEDIVMGRMLAVLIQLSKDPVEKKHVQDGFDLQHLHQKDD